METLQISKYFKFIAIIIHQQQMLTSMNVYLDYFEINNVIKVLLTREIVKNFLYISFELNAKISRAY